MTINNTNTYINDLKSIVDGYNSRYHTSLEMSPDEANLKKNEAKVFETLYSTGRLVPWDERVTKRKIRNKNVQSSMIKKFKKRSSKPREEHNTIELNDIVRIVKWRNVFKKGYTPNWSESLYKVINIRHVDRTMYKLESLSDGQEITGWFYNSEIQKYKPDNMTYEVESILKRRKNKKNGRQEVLIKWKHFPVTQATWQDASTVRDIAPNLL